MSTVDVPLEQALASADAQLDDVLDLVDASLEHAAAQGDGEALGRLATRLDDVAAQRGGEWQALAIAATRARSLIGSADVAQAQDAAPAHLPEAEPEVLELAYAGWWRRVFAFLIDWVVIGFALERLDVSTGAYWIAWVLLVPAYFGALPAAANGITAGKAALGIAIRSADGTKLAYKQALWRVVGMTLVWVTVIGAFVDVMLAGTDSRRQSLHDKLGRTIVVRTRV